MLGGSLGAIGVCGGASLLKAQKPQVELEKTDKSFIIKAKPIRRQ
jgi:hypothetical protein